MKTSKQLQVGDSATFEKVITDAVVRLFEVSGDNNPVHLDEDYAANTIFKTHRAWRTHLQTYFPPF